VTLTSQRLSQPLCTAISLLLSAKPPRFIVFMVCVELELGKVAPMTCHQLVMLCHTTIRCQTAPRKSYTIIYHSSKIGNATCQTYLAYLHTDSGRVTHEYASFKPHVYENEAQPNVKHNLNDHWG
jgi:hypothetical protein